MTDTVSADSGTVSADAETQNDLAIPRSARQDQNRDAQGDGVRAADIEW
jgi:hypothetical protein